MNPAATERLWRPGRPVELVATLAPLWRGSGDPTFRYGTEGSLWRTTRTPDGPATLRLIPRPAEGTVLARAWGAGAAWVLDRVPELLGAQDDPAGFEPRHPVVRETWRRHAGWRVPRTTRVLESLVPAVVEQKVTGREAWRAFRTLVKTYGEPAPGHGGDVPPGMWVQPDAATWRRVPSWAWHRAGVDLSRSRTVVTAAASAGRLEALRGEPEARRRLESLPGIGLWTSAEVAVRSWGDPDAVSVGDYHLPSLVGYALAGEPVDDDGMLELLEPYAGHRYRAVRMLELSGVRPQRRGPRYEGRDYRAM